MGSETVERGAFKLGLLSKNRVEKLERLSALLKALEVSFEELKRDGFKEEVIINYLQRASAKVTVVTLDKLRGNEVPKTLLCI